MAITTRQLDLFCQQHGYEQKKMSGETKVQFLARRRKEEDLNFVRNSILAQIAANKEAEKLIELQAEQEALTNI